MNTDEDWAEMAYRVAAGDRFKSKVLRLSKEQLQAGLARAVDEVDIAWEPIAMTGIRAIELESQTGIKFQKSFEDLDEGYFALLHFTGSFGVTLKDYPEAPVKCTRISRTSKVSAQ
jgi:hypothetical protein